MITTMGVPLEMSQHPYSYLTRVCDFHSVHPMDAEERVVAEILRRKNAGEPISYQRKAYGMVIVAKTTKGRYVIDGNAVNTAHYLVRFIRCQRLSKGLSLASIRPGCTYSGIFGEPA